MTGTANTQFTVCAHDDGLYYELLAEQIQDQVPATGCMQPNLQIDSYKKIVMCSDGV